MAGAPSACLLKLHPSALLAGLVLLLKAPGCCKRSTCRPSGVASGSERTCPRKKWSQGFKGSARCSLGTMHFKALSFLSWPGSRWPCGCVRCTTWLCVITDTFHWGGMVS